MMEHTRLPRAIGASGLASFPLGLGCASLSGSYGPSDKDNALRVLHEARARRHNVRHIRQIRQRAQ